MEKLFKVKYEGETWLVVAKDGEAALDAWVGDYDDMGIGTCDSDAATVEPVHLTDRGVSVGPALAA